jgi:hypothetical protein
MRKTVLALAVVAAAASASPASAERPCLQFGRIYNWKVINDRMLIVEDETHKKFRLKLIGACTNLRFHENLGFESPGGSFLSCLSPGDEVVTREFGTGRQDCAITHIDAYTPEMEQADKAAAQAAKDQRSGY